jgi:hypothetical protein
VGSKCQGGEHTIAAVLGSALISVADDFGLWGTGGIVIAFALLEPERLRLFLGRAAGGARVLSDIEAIFFRGASSPVHLRPTFFVRAMGKDGELEGELTDSLRQQFHLPVTHVT